MSSEWSDTTNGNRNTNDQRDALLIRLSQRVEALETEILYLKYPITSWRFFVKNVSLEQVKQLMLGITDYFEHIDPAKFDEKDGYGFFSVEDVSNNIALMDLCRYMNSQETSLHMAVKMKKKHYNDLFIINV